MGSRKCTKSVMLGKEHLYCGFLVICFTVFDCTCICTTHQLVAYDTPQSFTSSGGPDCLDKRVACEFKIFGPTDTKIHVRILRSQIDNAGSCQSGPHVKVFDGETFSTLLGRFCGQQTPTFDSATSVVTVKLSEGFGCSNSFTLLYESIESSQIDWSHRWKGAVIVIGCSTFIFIVFYVIRRIWKARHQRRTDMEIELVDMSENARAASNSASGNPAMDGTNTPFSAPPPCYDDVITNDDESPPSYLSVTHSAQYNHNGDVNNTSRVNE